LEQRSAKAAGAPLSGAAQGRQTGEQVTICKSLGHIVQDSAAVALWREAAGRGIARHAICWQRKGCSGRSIMQTGGSGMGAKPCEI